MLALNKLVIVEHAATLALTFSSHHNCVVQSPTGSGLLLSYSIMYDFLTNCYVCAVQMPGLGLSLTAVDSGLLSALQPGQTSLSLFLSSPDDDAVAGTGVILLFSSTGKS